jgi:hypothetical protein
MLACRPLMVGIDIPALLFDVRLTSGVSGKRAAANGTGRAHCIPAVLYASTIGFLVVNMTCQKILHKNAPSRCSTGWPVRRPLVLLPSVAVGFPALAALQDAPFIAPRRLDTDQIRCAAAPRAQCIYFSGPFGGVGAGLLIQPSPLATLYVPLWPQSAHA